MAVLNTLPSLTFSRMGSGSQRLRTRTRPSVVAFTSTNCIPAPSALANWSLPTIVGWATEAAQVEFSNSKLGLPHVGTGAQVTDAMIDGCLKNYTTTDNRPTDSKRCITIGVDQGKWNYVSVVEWFLDQYSNDMHEASLAKLLHFEKFLGRGFQTTRRTYA